MDFLAWTKHLMNKKPFRVSEESPAKELRPCKDRRKHQRFSFDAPIEYSTTDGSRPRGAYTGNVSEKGLLIYSVDDLPIAAELRIVIFYPDEYQFTCFEGLAKVVWKDQYYEKEWKGFKYGLELTQISEANQIKLREILLRASARESNLLGQMVQPESETMEPHQSKLAA